MYSSAHRTALRTDRGPAVPPTMIGQMAVGESSTSNPAAAIFFPSYSQTLSDDPGSAERQLRRWLIAVAGVGLVTYAALAVGGQLAARLLFGDSFAASGDVLAVLGLPVAVALAWVFEQTPDGLKRTEPARPEELVHTPRRSMRPRRRRTRRPAGCART